MVCSNPGVVLVARARLAAARKRRRRTRWSPARPRRRRWRAADSRCRAFPRCASTTARSTVPGRLEQIGRRRSAAPRRWPRSSPLYWSMRRPPFRVRLPEGDRILRIEGVLVDLAGIAKTEQAAAAGQVVRHQAGLRGWGWRVSPSAGAGAGIRSRLAGPAASPVASTQMGLKVESVMPSEKSSNRRVCLISVPILKIVPAHRRGDVGAHAVVQQVPVLRQRGRRVVRRDRGWDSSSRNRAAPTGFTVSSVLAAEGVLISGGDIEADHALALILAAAGRRCWESGTSCGRRTDSGGTRPAHRGWKSRRSKKVSLLPMSCMG